MRACEQCPNTSCEIKAPRLANSNRQVNHYEFCAIFSCEEGIKAAKAAYQSNRYMPMLASDGSQINAVLFGTPEKPTERSFPHRCCTRDGIIYGETADGTYRKTGQTIF